MKFKLTNKLRQALNVMLTDQKGKLRQWTLSSRNTRIVDESEMSQDVTDKEFRGYLVVEPLEE